MHSPVLGNGILEILCSKCLSDLGFLGSSETNHDILFSVPSEQNEFISNVDKV